MYQLASRRPSRELYDERRRKREQKRKYEGELNPGQSLTMHVNGSVLESITNDEEAFVSSPEGVNINPKTKELMFHNKLLEAWIAINILNEPGEIGTWLDEFTDKLDRIFQALNKDPVGTQKVFFNGANKTLKEVFTATTFNPLSASSDQIGRMPQDLESAGNVENWLSDELKARTRSGNFKRVLTKIKAISSFGTTMWQLLSSGREGNSEAVQGLLEASGLNDARKSKACLDRHLRCKRYTFYPSMTSILCR